MGTLFSETLVKLREAAGFATAYAFFHGNDGEKFLGIAYRRYLLIEQGENLPLADRLPGLIYSLRLVPGGNAANELVTAWLKTFAGEKTYSVAFEPLVAPRADAKGVSPMHEAMQRSLAEKKYYMTQEQFEAVLTSFDTYLCHQAMQNDTGAWKVEDLAAALRLTPAAARAALRTLAAKKLMKEVRKSVYRSPLAGLDVEVPQLSQLKPELTKKMDSYNAQLAASGRYEWVSSCLLRVDTAVFRGYIPVLNTAVHTATTYSVTKKSPKSALMLVESRITKLRDF